MEALQGGEAEFLGWHDTDEARKWVVKNIALRNGASGYSIREVALGAEGCDCTCLKKGGGVSGEV